MDWKNIIAEIQRHGEMTQSEIAKFCSCGQTTISDLSSGATRQPSFALGQALLDLHKKQTERRDAHA